MLMATKDSKNSSGTVLVAPKNLFKLLISNYIP
jgi:hypothetical protein